MKCILSFFQPQALWDWDLKYSSPSPTEIATEKIDNRRVAVEVALGFTKVAARSPIKVSRHQSFEHAHMLKRLIATHFDFLLVAKVSRSR